MDKMKKLIGIMVALTLVLSLCACSSQSAVEQKAESGAASESADADSSGVTQADIEKNIVGTWIKSEVDGQPSLTNEKIVFDIVSTTEAYSSVSVSPIDDGTPFFYNQKSIVGINGSIVTLTTTNLDGKPVVDELTVTSINNSGFTANRKLTITHEGNESLVREETVTFVKVNDDYSDDIIGTWEGCRTSEDSVFDDGQNHRWEYKDDGTYVYYVKDGDDWIPSENTLNEYFAAGNLLCTRWIDGDEEYREWWEITIDGDKMNWTALREDEDGKTFTAAFEMTKVKE